MHGTIGMRSLQAVRGPPQIFPTQLPRSILAASHRPRTTPIASLGPSKSSTSASRLITLCSGAIMASAAAAPLSPPMLKDPSSFSNPSSARITHTDLEIDVCFDSHTLSSWARHRVVVQADTASDSTLALDSRDLAITSVLVNGAPSSFTAGPPSKALGTAITVPLPPGLKAGDEVVVELAWVTSPDAVAAQWLTPEQTAGGKAPYLFTQCQAIHARTLVPLQDTPGAKLTYTAAVRVPAQLVALMSAIPEEEQGEQDLVHVPSRSPSPTRVFRFRQALPISSYLLALAVGDLVCKDLSPVSRVWAEPAHVEAAAYEFAETQQYLEAAEAIAGPYRWGRYDLLLLPPAFPYGGMENPVVTFVTPSLLAGDRSLANVVAHEISHSWTGNLVTNLTWRDFWLNEGWTVWLERKILGRMEGEASFQFHAACGRDTLELSVKNWGPDHPYTRLVIDTDGVDPDDAFSSIPYEKGFYFLYYLETLVGGADAMEAFFRAYVVRFAKEPLTSEVFRDFFLEHFISRGVTAVRDIDWQTWFFGLGMPPDVNHYDSSLAQAPYKLAERWHTCDVMGLGSPGPEGASLSDISGWSSAQIVAFLTRLGQLRSLTPLHPTTTRAMNALYGFDASRNAEVRCAWLLLCIKAGDTAVRCGVEDMLQAYGRMKYLRPLYKALARSERWAGGRELAVGIFRQAAPRYHPVARKMCGVDLNLGAEEGG